MGVKEILHQLFTGMHRAKTIATLLKELSSPALLSSYLNAVAVGKTNAAKYTTFKQKHFNQHYKEMQNLGSCVVLTGKWACKSEDFFF